MTTNKQVMSNVAFTTGIQMLWKKCNASEKQLIGNLIEKYFSKDKKAERLIDKISIFQIDC